MRNRGQFLRWVYAPDPGATETEAAKAFNLDDWQRKRLPLREQV
jgi:hypothetical protein